MLGRIRITRLNMRAMVSSARRDHVRNAEPNFFLVRAFQINELN